jgi:hypothetical protein
MDQLVALLGIRKQVSRETGLLTSEVVPIFETQRRVHDIEYKDHSCCPTTESRMLAEIWTPLYHLLNEDSEEDELDLVPSDTWAVGTERRSARTS